MSASFTVKDYIQESLAFSSDFMEDNVANSVILKKVAAKQKQDQDLLSAEDFAWADSCLIEDPEISETNMDSIKEALLDILDQHTEILSPSANEKGDSNDVTAPENFPSLMEEGEGSSEHSDNEGLDASFSVKNPFNPHYNDEMMNIQYLDDDDVAGFVFPESMMEPLAGDIFKVWDLDIIPNEEYGLAKELKEALSLKEAKKKEESLNSLVEGVAGLSLK